MTGFATKCAVWAVLLAVVGPAMAGQEALQPARSHQAAGEAAGDARLRKANQEFEAAALQVMLAPMFSRKEAKLFGEGAAGKYWQSMLSEQIARQIAASGRLHLMPAPGGRRPPQTKSNSIRPLTAKTCTDKCTGKGWSTKVLRVSRETP